MSILYPKRYDIFVIIFVAPEDLENKETKTKISERFGYNIDISCIFFSYCTLSRAIILLIKNSHENAFLRSLRFKIMHGVHFDCL